MPLSPFEQQLKTSLAPAGVPDQLVVRVLAAIQRRQRVKLAWSGIAAAVFTGCFMFSAWSFSRQLSNTGTLMFIRLLFTDTGIIMHDWRAYTLSMLESLPVIPLVLLLSSSAAMIWSAKLLTGIPRTHQRLAN